MRAICWGDCWIRNFMSASERLLNWIKENAIKEMEFKKLSQIQRNFS